MGYERKRGKLGDLNSLLRGNPGDRFSLIVGDIEVLSQVKYVITLDTDTQLPRDSARELIGAMAHLLNWPQFDRPRFDWPPSNRPRASSADASLQRATASCSHVWRSACRAHAARSMRGCTAASPGMDPYTRTVSDVYQDAFGEGSFIGKGIYDVDAFESALADRFPDNRILSHDLLEGATPVRGC